MIDWCQISINTFRAFYWLPKSKLWVVQNIFCSPTHSQKRHTQKDLQSFSVQIICFLKKLFDLVVHTSVRIPIYNISVILYILRVAHLHVHISCLLLFFINVVFKIFLHFFLWPIRDSCLTVLAIVTIIICAFKVSNIKKMLETIWSTLKYLDRFENWLLKKPITNILLFLNSDSENKLIINKCFKKQNKQENLENKVWLHTSW